MTNPPAVIWYQCREDGCIHKGIPRPVTPEPLGNGLLAWPHVSCICSPQMECPIVVQATRCPACGQLEDPTDRFHVCPSGGQP